MTATPSPYVHLMKRALSPYDWTDLVARRAPSGERLDIHAYARIACVGAGLHRAGELNALVGELQEIITSCCEDLAVGERLRASDFAAKEVLLAVELLEPAVPAEQVAGWDRLLAQIDPYGTYRQVIRTSEDVARMHNINIYMLVGEFLRERRGLTTTESLFDAHWPTQLTKFDAEGRYRDPGGPMLYDVATRVQIQHLLHSGYTGAYAERLDAHLRTAGLASLRTQSASGEISFGGRSNQFLFNEVLHAASCEYEARRWSTEGDTCRAERFRGSARLALASIDRWLAHTPPRSMKNLFAPEVDHGTEPYGYYEKYMTSVGSFAVLAWLFTGAPDLQRPDQPHADHEPADHKPPALTGGHITSTTADFHQIVAAAGGYSVQIDTRANPQYDATGLGRVHRCGVPSELALSVPLPGGDGYALATESERGARAIGPAWRTADGHVHRLAESGDDLGHELQIHHEDRARVDFTIRSRPAPPSAEATDAPHNRSAGFDQRYVLDATGLDITTTWDRQLERSAPSEWWLEIPVLVTNGGDRTAIRTHQWGLSVSLDGFVYRIETDHPISLGDERLGNRNGIYRVARLTPTGTTCRVHLSLNAATPAR